MTQNPILNSIKTIIKKVFIYSSKIINNNSRLLKGILSIVIIATTVILFVKYSTEHPNVLNNIMSLNGYLIIFLLIGYILVLAINAFVLHQSLLFLKVKSLTNENYSLTAYSSIVNFFGPLQSGPGFRAIYLKKKYGIKIKDFLITTLIFYFFFGISNTLIIIYSISINSTNTMLLCIAIIIITISLLSYYMHKRRSRMKQILDRVRLNDKSFWLIGLGSIGISLSSMLIYLVELLHVNPGVSIYQVLVYTASANMSIFVSLTPGAIGIREAFLTITQQLHQIDTASIIGANIIDRSFYILFLASLSIILLVINGLKKISKHNRLEK